MTTTEYDSLGSGPGPELFWDDYFRRTELENALKVATPADAVILLRALEPIKQRQSEYWSKRQHEYEIHEADLQAGIAGFSKSEKEHQ